MKGKQITRTKRLIETDRLGFVNGSEELIRRDIENLLGEYFCLSGPIRLKIDKNYDKIEISVVAESSSVKRFNLIK